MEPRADTKQASTFLEWLRPAGPWVLTAIGNDRVSIETRTFSSLEPAAAWVGEQNEKHRRNCYFHTNPTTQTLSKKAEATDIAALEFLHVDLDPTPGEDIDKERARILSLLNSPPAGIPKPSAVVFSGGGYQAFWRLAAPEPINGDPERAEDLKHYNLQIELQMGADSCHNVDRVLRIPGTINWPNEKKRARGQVPVVATALHLGTESYPLSSFTKATRVQDHVPDAGGGTAATRVQVSGNARRHVDLDDLTKELNPRVKVVIAHGRDEDQGLAGRDQSRSAWLMYVVGALVRAGVDDETVYALITDPDYRISASVLDKGNSAQVHRYACRQIKRAKEDKIAPELAELNERYALVESVGGRMRIAKESYDEALGRHEVEFLLVDGFKTRHCNRYVMVDAGKDANGNAKTRAVPLGEWWLGHPERRTFDKVLFYPCREFAGALNLWRGFAFDAMPGDCSLFIDHLKRVLCRGDEANYQYLLGWMANAVQHPYDAGQVAVVCRGKQGTGKGASARHFGKLFGVHFKHVTNPEHVTGKFNTALHDAAFLFADECFKHDKAHVSALKALITEETLRVEAKGVDNLESRNCTHLWMNTNEDWAVHVSLDDRRFFVLDVPDDRRKDVDYFAAMGKQMDEGGYSALLHLLLSMDLKGFDVRRVPATKELRRQQQRSMSPAESFWFQCLDESRLSPGHDGWTGEVVIDEFVDRFLDGYGRHMTPHQAKTILGMFLGRAGAGFSKSRRRGQPAQWVDSRGRNRSSPSPSVWRFASVEKCRDGWDREFGVQEWASVEETPVDVGGPF